MIKETPRSDYTLVDDLKITKRKLKTEDKEFIEAEKEEKAKKKGRPKKNENV